MVLHQAIAGVGSPESEQELRQQSHWHIVFFFLCKSIENWIKKGALEAGVAERKLLSDFGKININLFEMEVFMSLRSCGYGRR